MPYVSFEPIVPSMYIDDLRYAVACWDYEGGADVTSPQEGFRIFATAATHEPDRAPPLATPFLHSLVLETADHV